MPFLKVDGANGANLYYELDGAGPPLLLIMGLGGNSQVWAPIRRQLASRYRLIMYDMLGTGRSDPAPPSTTDTLSAELDALFAHLNLERVLALGLSFGASVLLNYAARRPQQFQALSLVGGLFKVTPYVRAYIEIQSELARTLPRGQFMKQAFLWMASESFCERNPEFFERFVLLARGPQTGDDAGWHGWRQFANSVESDYCEILRQLTIPTQILHGSADRVSSIEQVRQAASVRPAIQLDVIPDAGHMLIWDMPEATLEDLFGFFQKHQAALPRASI
jgi:pimeloyl-ACP methyl ester carboxylesterase